MKLFLSSTSLPGTLRDEFAHLADKPLEDIRVALFENAADPYPDERKGFVAANFADLSSTGLQITQMDLRQFIGKTNSLRSALEPYDAIWFGGGNTFYLRWLMRESGFEDVIADFLRQGGIYAGGSAGAIVAGPLLNHFEIVDDPALAPVIIFEGLGLTDIIPLPHWNSPKFQERLTELRCNLVGCRKEMVILTDEQAVVINGDSWYIHPQKNGIQSFS